MNRYSFWLHQKLFSNPCRTSNSKRRKHLRVYGVLIAARQGFEPRLTVPETAVLPLDDRAM